VDIIYDFLNCKNFTPGEEVKEIILQSALLPSLECSFRSGSLLEMGKECDLFFSYLKLINAISQHQALLPCLLPLGRQYEPK